MADFTVAHLIVGQADVSPAGMDQRVGIFAQQAVVNRFASQRDGVGFGFGAISPAVEDDENQRFWMGHRSKSSLINSERSIRRYWATRERIELRVPVLRNLCAGTVTA